VVEILCEFLLQVILPFFIEVLVDGVFGFGSQRAAERFGKDRLTNPRAAFLFYGLIGATFGGLSVLFLPMHLIKNRTAQYANLILTPIVIGLAFEWLGRRRTARGQPEFLARFLYGFIFTLMMCLVRFEFAR
jgi:hypothetical protein